MKEKFYYAAVRFRVFAFFAGAGAAGFAAGFFFVLSDGSAVSAPTTCVAGGISSSGEIVSGPYSRR